MTEFSRDELDNSAFRSPFWRELDEGLINYRDRLQFELKSEFFINPDLDKNIYKQEFFLFIPETLQINSHTYSRDQFYLDQTSLARYKTPRISLEEILDASNTRSPLLRIQQLDNPHAILEELKILGNSFRSAIRNNIRTLLKQLKKSHRKGVAISIKSQVENLCAQTKQVRSSFIFSKSILSHRYSHLKFDEQANYIDEFMGLVISDYFSAFLNELREHHPHTAKQCEQSIYQCLEEEALYQAQHSTQSRKKQDPLAAQEAVLLRKGLLEKFLLGALRLKNNRIEIKEKHSGLFGAFAAGVAMLVYMIFFVWHASTYAISSVPFVLFAVILYIMKDRIKEGLKQLYQKRMHRLFPDYKTSIFSPIGDKIGMLTESFSFTKPDKLPPAIHHIRYKEIPEQIDSYHPQESIMQYKRQVILSNHNLEGDYRRNELNTIFRYNIHRFLEKANDAMQPIIRLNTETKELETLYLPKVYHLTIILKNSFLNREGKDTTETKPFRVVLDKDGIRRVEHL